jgi:hypothetical protein
MDLTHRVEYLQLSFEYRLFIRFFTSLGPISFLGIVQWRPVEIGWKSEEARCFSMRPFSFWVRVTPSPPHCWKFLRRSQSAGLILDEAPSNARELTGQCRRNLWHRASLCVAGDVHEGEARSVSSLVGGKALDCPIESVDQLPQGRQVRIGPERAADPVEKCGITPVELARARGIVPLLPYRRIANPLAGELRQCGVAYCDLSCEPK